ncbi:iron-containing alcohol dehydrogenase [Fimbriiglobus ruber]|uniref:Alcohol dehydrogenase n=1 Tax=Fimbriiglobus ruber TaxID=1908690 RepID=A0A225DID7_9BACT|nr:iron-containing alcohol dehydrogenase [Fimbriiglobus ruber]OWK35877.1 alcohol dehydrogenase [Fimbriiglobus ruber]
MRPWTFHSAGTLLFGRDAVHQLGTVASRLKAKRVFVVTDEVLVRVGVAARVTEPLAAAGLTINVFTGCAPEPPVEVVRAAVAAARAFAPDVVLGLGGGSNMDVSKLVALILAHGGDPTDYVGDCRVPGPIYPLICVPTTAGTGSEVSAAAVFTDTAKKIKVSCLSPYLRPAAAVVDPLLTVGCPKTVTADSGIDALTHAIEAFTAVDQDEFLDRPPGGETVYQGKNPIADVMATTCIGLVARFLRRAVADGNDLEAREAMAQAATLGGLAFANAGVALVHAMEYPVGGAVHVSHGAGNGLLLPYVMRYNLPARAKTIAALSEPFGKPFHGTDHLAAAEGVIEKIEHLRADIGIPTRLREIGVTEAMLHGFAEKAFAIKRLMRVNPRMPASADEILEIYKAAY